MKQETLEEKLDKIVSKEPSKFWAESDERFKNKETLEEAFKFWSDRMSSYDKLDILRFGAVWQQERSYSEEETIQLLIKFNQEIQEVEDVREWFEQFKKK